MNTLAVDIETFSKIDLKKAGIYRYCEDPEFTILLFSYKWNDDPIICIDLTKGIIPDRIVKALRDPLVLKTAFNAAFEIACLSAYYMEDFDPAQWSCTQILCAMLGLPFALDKVSEVLGLKEKKDTKGAALIKYFSCPCKPTKVNGMRTRNLPEHAPEKWLEYCLYNPQDVAVEQAVRDKIKFFEQGEYEKQVWNLDQKINSAGVKLDTVLARNAISMNRIYTSELIQEAIDLTGLNNPKSVAQIKTWIAEESGEEEIKSLNKDSIPDLIKNTDSLKIKRLLEIRQQIGKSSVSKYAKMIDCVCMDGYVKGQFQYYGANNTGRFASRLIQLQNLPKNVIDFLGYARQLVYDNDLDTLKLIFGNVAYTLSQLLRTAFVGDKPGDKLLVADLSSIEARITTWLAGEKWRLDIFNGDGKIYEASASRMFKVPMAKCGKGSDYRARGKVAELALGFGGSKGALLKMDTKKQLKEDELMDLVYAWRAANPKIVQYWYNINDAAIRCIEMKAPQQVGIIKMHMDKNILWIKLPSDRYITYPRPAIAENKFGNPGMTYEGIIQKTHQWGKIETYGGSLVENIVQGIARDILVDIMLRTDATGYTIRMHIHDEIVCDKGKGSLEEVLKIMTTPIDWAKGLPLGADGFETTYYYKKD